MIISFYLYFLIYSHNCDNTKSDAMEVKNERTIIRQDKKN